MFFALLWLYNEYNEHVQNLDPSTKCTSIWALACLDMPRLDTERPDIEILQNVEFKILCSHATYQECMSSLWCLHCGVFMWNLLGKKPLPSAWSQNLQTSDLLRRLHNLVRSQNGAMTISCESYLKSSIAVTQQKLTRIWSEESLS